MSEYEARYCEECFVGWHEDEQECWQCAHPISITKAEGDRIMAMAELTSRVSIWTERTRRW